MLTGERRGASARRGMTVLGKIPAVPKPINLPSQRLENRGLDPNVEIVPRGSVSWGAAGRSPPTSGSPWGNSTQASSPPVGNGPWGSGPKPGPPQGTTGGPWVANASRPSSAGSGTRPSSAGSIGQIHEAPVASNAWGSATGRPSSASGVLGQAQSQPPVPRPRSAETRTLNGPPPPLTRFADHPNRPPSPAAAAWGGAGTARKLSEDSHSLHQPARFTLTRGDFPTLGSEKNPDLRPQQNKGGSPAERPGSGDGKGFPSEERPPPGPGGPYDDIPPTGHVYGGQERIPEGWRRDAGPYGGHPGMGDGAWHRDGPPHPLPQHGGGQHQPDTWRRDPGHGAAPGGAPSDDNWRRTGPPVGPYGPPGPGRFQHEGFMHQQRYGPGPGPYGRGGGPGPAGFARHGEMYGNAGPYARPGGAPPPRPGPPMGPGMYQGPGPYDNYYGPPGVPGPGYGNMDEREMMMLGMGGGPPGMYNNFPQGPPEPFGRFPHGGPGPGPRHMQQNNSGMMRDRNEGIGYEGDGYRESLKYKEGPNFKEGGGFKDGYGKDSGYTRERPASAGEVPREGHVTSSGSGSGSKMPRPSSARGRDHGGHQDWAAAASNDEPMDWTKPVFEEDVTSASPGLSKQSSTVSRSGTDALPAGDDVRTSEGTRRDPPPEPPASDDKKGWTGSVDNRDEPAPQMTNPGTDSKSDYVQTWRQIDVDSHDSGPKARTIDNTPQETRDGRARTTLPVEDVDTTDKRPVKDGRLSGPVSRERSFGREHAHSLQAGRSGVKRDSSSSHAGANAASAVRSTQHGFVGVNNRSNVANAPRVPTPEVVPEEVVSSPVTEKHVSCPASPSGSDGQRNSERLRILKRAGEGPDSPQKDVNSENVHVEVPVEPKEDLRFKSKSASTHDGEKEWRPKAPLTVSDATLETGPSSVPTSKKQSAPSFVLQSVPPAAKDPSDKAAADAEVSTDSYDYDAQRARMKEIAAQRARQLRKEEEERSKEQKAKALAKLEELNRRSSASPVTQSAGQLVAEVNHQVPTASTADESEVVPSEEVEQEGAVNESGGTGASTPRGGVRSGRNDYGKRERVIDRKGSGRSREEHRGKVGSEENREPPKPRLNVPLGQTKTEAPLLPSPSQEPSTPAAVPPPSVSVPYIQQVESRTGPVDSSASQTAHIQHQAPSKAQDARHRAKQFVSQTKQMGKQSPTIEEVEFPIGQETVPPADSTGKAGGWTGGSPLDLEPKDATLGLAAGHSNNEAGAVAFRKKKSKSSGRNKQRLEIGTSVTNGSSGEVNQGWNIGSSTVNHSANEMGKVERDTAASAGDDEQSKVMSPTTVVKEVASIDVKLEPGTGEQNKDAGIESGGSDVGSVKHNGDIPVKRSQRGKSQPARRVVRGERGTSQDVRVADKPHAAGEGLVWAVRSPSGTHPNGVKGGFGEGIVESPGVKKDEPPVVQQTARARRAELERYTPKPVVKQHAQQQEEMQQHASSLPGQHHAIDTSVVPGVVDGPTGPTTFTEIKFGSEARQSENVIKHGRSHAWRQRGPGSERGAGPKEAFHAQQAEPAENNTKFQQSGVSPHNHQSHPRSRPVSNSSSEQPKPMTSPHPKPGVGQVNRQQAPPFSVEKELPNSQFSQQGRGHHNNPPAQPPVSTNREHKTPQDNLPAYQPSRPASSQLSRGVETEGQSSHDHSRSQRGNALQIDRLNNSSGKYDREFHTSQDRPASHHQPRHHSKHHGGANSQERDQIHSGVVNSQRFSSQTTADGVPSGEKGQASDPTTGAGQGRPASQPIYGRQSAPTSGERERSPSRPGSMQQAPRSPGRQRGRQHAVFHERDQTGPPHHHHQSKYRQSGHEREHHREVSNAVHHQQPRTPLEGHWQQTGVAPDREQPNDLGHSYQHSGRATHKSQSLTTTELDQGSVSHPGSHHYTRSESSSKSHGSVQGDGHKPSHYQPVSVSSAQYENVQQQGVPAGEKLEKTHNSPHWSGEAGEGFASRGREYRGRGRFGSRSSGAGGRHGDIEGRREQSSKQRPGMEAPGSVVPSQVAG